MNPTSTLRAQRAPLADPAVQRRILESAELTTHGKPSHFDAVLQQHGVALQPLAPRVLQINVGKLCNLTCQHCHVDAGPDRTDAMMSDATVDACLSAIERLGVSEVDLTGGAPELHPAFKRLVVGARNAGAHVMDRCNLTVLLLPRNKDLVGFLAEHHVEVVASLPHFRARNTDGQRGSGVWAQSIRALRLLNEAGYGQGDPKHRLTLVSNPSGAYLQTGQAAMEALWKERLAASEGVTFDRLFLLNNLPVSRFLEALQRANALESYLLHLLAAFNPGTVNGLMCRDTVSVGWDGRVHDCDFNQMLDLEAGDDTSTGWTLQTLTAQAWSRRTIRTGRHCFGCTAGAGSSCGGATA